ncbi:MAG: ATP-dependent zinc metalloprotease FtsH [Candidatus Marinimicrobia bacterium]|nr:ATP-dependent zinc metalloprotease FtsH [Candidatus Neomarinimicrobiota bacterium]
MVAKNKNENEEKMKRKKSSGKNPLKKLKLRPKETSKRANSTDGENQPGKKAVRNLMLWLMIAVGFIILAQILAFDQKEEIEVSFSEFRSFLLSGIITQATIVENEFHGELYNPATVMRQSKRGGIDDSTAVVVEDKFMVILPANYADSEVLAEWDRVGLKYNFKVKSMDWVGYLLQLSPWILIFVFWFIMMRRMQGGGPKGIFSFGKSKARILTDKDRQITFKDVAGADEAKHELEEVIGFLKEPEKFSRLGGKIPKGILLTGPPGTGKTLLAKAVAGEADVPFFSISGADFVEMFVGVGASRVRDLFEQGRKNAPCIIFIDELDAVGRTRGAGVGGGHDEREQTLNQLLVEMDGFESTEGVILISATNRADVLDKALLRPGRFDRLVIVGNPDVRGRMGILKIHTRNVKLAKNIDLSILAKGTPGLSGADLANLVNEAALLASSKDKKVVEIEDFEDAKDKVMMGVARTSMIISDGERMITAYHEAGHALVARSIPDADPIHKVTIIPRGGALGVTHQLPIDERHNYSRTMINTQLAILLGGRAAEKLIYDEYTTGAGNDIERATELSRKMVCEWGMSDKLGPLTFGKKGEEIFLAREISQHRDYSENTAMKIDSEVSAIVLSAEERATSILKKRLSALKRIAEGLLEREIINSKELDTLIAGKKLAPPSNGRHGKEKTKRKNVSSSRKKTKEGKEK